MQDLHEAPLSDVTPQSGEDVDIIQRLRHALEQGEDWPVAILEAMALWRTPHETYDDRLHNYFIDGEAFDWLLLAERLCDAVSDLIPTDERETLLFTGRLPDRFDSSKFKELLGVHKHRGYLNYFYGVIVEEALQLAVELEVHKRQLSKGNQYQDDFSEEAFVRIYRRSKSALLDDFRSDMGYPCSDSLALTQSKEFTYWLFKYRMRTADKARVASDTRKGLAQLQVLADTHRSTTRIIGYATEDLP